MYTSHVAILVLAATAISPAFSAPLSMRGGISDVIARDHVVSPLAARDPSPSGEEIRDILNSLNLRSEDVIAALQGRDVDTDDLDHLPHTFRDRTSRSGSDQSFSRRANQLSRNQNQNKQNNNKGNNRNQDNVDILICRVFGRDSSESSPRDSEEDIIINRSTGELLNRDDLEDAFDSSTVREDPIVKRSSEELSDRKDTFDPSTSKEDLIVKRLSGKLFGRDDLDTVGGGSGQD